MDVPKLLTLSEVAIKLGVSQRTLSEYVKHEDLPVVRLSRTKVRIDPRQLDAWILAHSSEAEAEHI
jgi:excisionase family DNA binding protein